MNLICRKFRTLVAGLDSLFSVISVACILGALTAHAADFEVPAPSNTYSPVDLIDISTMISSADTFQQDADTAAFRDVLKIVYDLAIQRPWGDGYWPEANRRWQTVRSQLCPELKNFCAIPATLSSQVDLGNVINAIQDDTTWDELAQYFAKPKSGHPSHINRVNLPEGSDVSSPDFLWSTRETDTWVKTISVWGMTPRTILRKDKEFIQLFDLNSYQAGFNNGTYAGYLWTVFNQPDQIIYNIDSIKTIARNFADSWKYEMNRNRTDKIYRQPMLYFEAVMLRALYKKHQPEFAAAYDQLVAKLTPLPASQSKPTLDRFAAERAKNSYPAEAFQQVSYDLIRKELNLEGDYYNLALVQRNGLASDRMAWESLLALQAQTDPALLLYFAVEQGINWTTTPIGQFMSSSTLLNFFNEEIQAILGTGPYQGHDVYSQFSYIFQAPDLFDPDYLQSENPDLLKVMTDASTGKVRDFLTLDVATQKSVLSRYFFQADGKVRSTGLYRLMMTIALGIRDNDAAKLAQQIHEVRIKEFIHQ